MIEECAKCLMLLIHTYKLLMIQRAIQTLMYTESMTLDYNKMFFMLVSCTLACINCKHKRKTAYFFHVLAKSIFDTICHAMQEISLILLLTVKIIIFIIIIDKKLYWLLKLCPDIV